MRNLVLLVFCLLLFFSCKKEVEIPMPQAKKLPIVNSLFCAGDTICVSIYESVASLDGVPKIIDDALVLLYEDDNPADTLVYTENGLYISDIIAKIGSVYKVEAFCNGHKTCYARDTVPELPVLTGVVFRDSALIDRDGYYISKAELSLNSVGLKTGYYQVKMFARYFDYGGIEEIGNMSFSQINNTDPVFLETESSLLEYSLLLFSDNLFLNQSYVLPVYYYDRTNQWNSYYSDYDLIVSIRAVSANYYKYKCSEIIQDFEGNGLFTPGNNLSAMPVSLYSNVENGFGIFAAYSVITDTFPKQ
ncbi:MAG: DUF4249 domain-containing protein [Bacteroidales bacterium]|nr:DUF4249 domain-containing protein [Bacteroidales bacterium]